MKKLTIILILVITTCQLSTAQHNFKSGFRFGIGQSKFSDEVKNQVGKLVLQGGVTASYRFADFLSIEGDVLLTSRGGIVNGEDIPPGIFQGPEKYQRTINLIYAEIPALLSGNVGAGNFKVKGFVGPSMNFNLLANDSKEYDDNNVDADHGYTFQQLENIELLEFSIVYGLGLEIGLENKGAFFFDFRNSQGLSENGLIVNGNGEEVATTNNYFSISMGIRYAL